MQNAHMYASPPAVHRGCCKAFVCQLRCTGAEYVHPDPVRAARSGAYNRTLTPFGFQAEERTLWQAPQTYITMSPFMQARSRVRSVGIRD